MSSNAKQIQKLLDEVQTLHEAQQVLKEQQTEKHFAIAQLYAHQIPIADNKKSKRSLGNQCLHYLKQALCE